MSLIPEDGRILFFRRDRNAFGFLSNFHPSPIVLDGMPWPTVEHYYQAQKSFCPVYRKAIRDASGPGHAKRLGADPSLPGSRSKGSWFRSNQSTYRKDWPEVKLEIMRTAVLAKFQQNSPLARLLLDTGAAVIVEDSASDSFWGIGSDEQGQNSLGCLLMEARAELASPWLQSRESPPSVF